MFVVPLPGDSVETEGGVKHTVLSYAPYQKEPSVYVQAADGAVSNENVLFSAITSINGTPVTLTPGKVFKADSLIKRKIQLPQVGDKTIVKQQRLKVKDLKLRLDGKLTNGVVVICESDAKDHIVIRLRQIEDLDRASGDQSFNRQTFVTTYKDYLGADQ